MGQPIEFKWKHFEAEIILLCVRWYCSYSLSYRDLVEMLSERGLVLAHTTIMRWVHEYAPKIHKKIGKSLRKTNRFWKVDETMIKLKGKWVYLYRAVDSEGHTLEFMLSETRKKSAAKKFFKKILKAPQTRPPFEITVDKHKSYPPAFQSMKSRKIFSRKSKLKKSKYKNNILEQDHRFIKKMARKTLGFYSMDTAIKTISGIEAVHMLRKEQTRRNLNSGFLRAQFINSQFGIII